MDFWFVVSCVLGGLLAISLYYNITGWRNLIKKVGELYEDMVKRINRS